MQLTPCEQAALRYLGHIYLKQDRLVPLERHNSPRRLNILKRLQDGSGPFEPGDSVQQWLARRRGTLAALRLEARQELRELLEPLIQLGPELQEAYWEEISAERLFAPPLAARDIEAIERSGKRERLAELALNILDLAGREQELNGIS